MTTIQLQVSDDIIKIFGIEAIQAKLQKYLEWERVYLSANEIKKATEEAGVDNDKRWGEARAKAWTKFKEHNLQGILK